METRKYLSNEKYIISDKFNGALSGGDERKFLIFDKIRLKEMILISLQ